MVSKSALIGTFLLVSSALAVHPSQPRAPLSYTDPNSGRSVFPKPPAYGDADEPSGIRWNNNMAGSMLTGDFFNSITATFTIPSLTGSDGSTLITLGLDEGGCVSGYLVVGIQGTIIGGKVSWAAYSHWPPDPRVYINVFMKAGDVITVTIEAPKTTIGVVIWENETTGVGELQVFDATDSNSLCTMSAGWFVKAVWDQRGSLVPLADFGNITFTAMANGVYFPSGPSMYDIYSIQHNELYGLTSVKVDGEDLIVKYGTM